MCNPVALQFWIDILNPTHRRDHDGGAAESAIRIEYHYHVDVSIVHRVCKAVHHRFQRNGRSLRIEMDTRRTRAWGLYMERMCLL